MNKQNIILQEGEYRILEMQDLSYDIGHLKGDCFCPDVNPDVPTKALRIAEEGFERKVSEEGVYGYILEKWNPAVGCGWEDIDSCWGFVGDFKTENHYIVHEFIEYINNNKQKEKENG